MKFLLALSIVFLSICQSTVITSTSISSSPIIPIDGSISTSLKRSRRSERRKHININDDEDCNDDSNDDQNQNSDQNSDENNSNSFREYDRNNGLMSVIDLKFIDFTASAQKNVPKNVLLEKKSSSIFTRLDNENKR